MNMQECIALASNGKSPFDIKAVKNFGCSPLEVEFECPLTYVGFGDDFFVIRKEDYDSLVGVPPVAVCVQLLAPVVLISHTSPAASVIRCLLKDHAASKVSVYDVLADIWNNTNQYTDDVQYTVIKASIEDGNLIGKDRSEHDPFYECFIDCDESFILAPEELAHLFNPILNFQSGRSTGFGLLINLDFIRRLKPELAEDAAHVQLMKDFIEVYIKKLTTVS